MAAKNAAAPISAISSKRNASFNRLAATPTQRTAQPVHPIQPKAPAADKPAENCTATIAISPVISVTATKQSAVDVEGIYHQLDFHVPDHIVYLRATAVPCDPHGQRFLWCTSGEWRFVRALRHSERSLLRCELETMAAIPAGGWKMETDNPDPAKAWAPAGIVIAPVAEEKPVEGADEQTPAPSKPVTLNSEPALFAGDGIWAGRSFLGDTDMTRGELWLKLASELELALLAVLRDAAAKHPDKIGAIPTYGNLLHGCLNAMLGGPDGKADTRVVTLFAKHGKAYNLQKYAASLLDFAPPPAAAPLVPDYGTTSDKPGPLETIVTDMIKFLGTVAPLGEASGPALELATANLNAWKTYLTALRNRALYAERGELPVEPLLLRLPSHDSLLANPFHIDERVVLTRVLTIVASATNVFVGTGRPASTTRMEDLGALLQQVMVMAEGPSPPSPTQMRLFSFFQDLLLLVTTTSLVNADVAQWLAAHDVTDIATAWQQYEYISREQLVKVALARARTLFETWDDWPGSQHNVTQLRLMWEAEVAARELAGRKPPQKPSSIRGRGSPRVESPNAPSSPELARMADGRAAAGRKVSTVRAVPSRAATAAGKRTTSTAESPLAGPPAGASPHVSPSHATSGAAREVHSQSPSAASPPKHEGEIAPHAIHPDVLAAASALLAEGADIRAAHPEAATALLRYEQVLVDLLAGLVPPE
eukprot:m.182944 g.182944  ORF g.182944 m.182944 type:complete len:709 (-) comp15385_c3_seq2:23-2149(-)